MVRNLLRYIIILKINLPVIAIFLLSPVNIFGQGMNISAEAGQKFNSYHLMFGSEDEISWDASSQKFITLAAGGRFEEKFELHFIYSRVMKSTVDFIIDGCNCSFPMKGPSYNEFGLEFSYFPFFEAKLSPFVAFRYSLNFVDKENLYIGYLDSVNNYGYFLQNRGPETRPLRIDHGFQSLTLSLGATWMFHRFIGLKGRIGATATTSEYPIQVILMEFQSKEHQVADNLYHNGFQPEFLIGLKLDLSKIKSYQK